MSDGPHRTLPMRRGWKRLAKRADKSAFNAEDVKDAVEDFAEEAKERVDDVIERGSEWADEIKDRVEPLGKAIRNR